MSPTLPDVRGVITVGVPTNASELLPLRNAMLQCQCVWPDLPCQGEPLYPPQPNTTSGSRSCLDVALALTENECSGHPAPAHSVPQLRSARGRCCMSLLMGVLR